MEKNIHLISLALQGDKQALKEIIKIEEPNIYTMLYYLKKDDIDINDIAQNVLLKLASKIKQLKNPNNFKTWLNQIIIRTYYDYLRKNKRKKIFPFFNIDDKNTPEVSDSALNPQEQILNNELDLIIKNSIEMLPKHYKIPIMLREIQGLSYDEISKVTNSSIGTVKSRIARARTLIKDKIDKYNKG